MSINLTTKEVETLTKIDSVDSNTTYIGEAKLGAADDAAVWQILKIIKSGTVTEILSADGDLRFNHVWDNRASLSYS